jgi:hypothetical protein
VGYVQRREFQPNSNPTTSDAATSNAATSDAANSNPTNSDAANSDATNSDPAYAAKIGVRRLVPVCLVVEISPVPQELQDRLPAR